MIKNNNNDGFTLIEMVVAMTLFVAVIVTVMSIFLRSVQTERGVAGQSAGIIRSDKRQGAAGVKDKRSGRRCADTNSISALLARWQTALVSHAVDG